MRARLLRLTFFLAVIGLFAIGCDDDPGPIVTPDGGADAGVPDEDGGPPPDEVPPFVVSTTPAHGAEVAADVAIEVVFSEAMDDATDVEITADGADVTFDAPTWHAAGTTLTITPSAALPERASILVTLGTGFADAAGNALSAPYELSFSIADATGPTVVESSPADGATDVSSRLRVVEIAFSEPMNNRVGALAISDGTIGEPEWIDNDRLRADVTGLVNATGYTITLTGFVDSAGNAYDTTGSLGGDGALDFTTRADDEAPRVLDTNPAEGQINVRVRATPVIVVQFDEPMDTSITDAALTGGATATLSGTWSTAGTEITFATGTSLIDDRAHSLSLAGFVDATGNALDTETYLGDGRLDFHTGADSAAPRLLYSSPVEGSADAPYTLDEVNLYFDKAMDTSTTTLTLEDVTRGASTEVSVTWNLSGTRAIIDVTGLLYSAHDHRIVLTSLEDTMGTPMDLADAYLEDGALDFTGSEPTGEQCRDVLTIGQATSSVDGVHVFEFANLEFALNDGSATCDPSGIVADGVIRYTKTTPNVAGGGTALRIRADSNQDNSSNGLNVEVFAGECDPTVAGADAARQICLFSSRRWEQFLDVGPGEYFIWISHVDDQFEDATITLEEVALPPEGEGCLDPFDTSSPNYTAPTGPGEPHRWVIEDNLDNSDGPRGMLSVDMGEAVTCDPDGVQGADGVIRFEKESATSVVRVIANEETGSSGGGFSFEVRDACGPGGASYACVAEQELFNTPIRNELYFEGPAGDYYAWFASSGPSQVYPGGALEVTEIEPLEGSSCDRARPLTIGGAMTVPVAPDVMQRIRPPSCGGPDAQYTWYRFTTTEEATLVASDAAAHLAIVNATSDAEISCDETVDFGSAFLPVGTEVCVAIQSGSSVSALEITPVDYTGVRGEVTDLYIERPVSGTGSTRVLSGTKWIAVTPSAIYLNAQSQGFLRANRVGYPPPGAQPEFYELQSFRNAFGNTAAAAGESVFVMDSGTGADRLYRFANSLGVIPPVVPEVWEATGATWPADEFDAMTYDGTALILVDDWDEDVPVRFYSMDPTTPSAPTLLHPNASSIRGISALAADADYFYVLGTDGTDVTTDGLYRVTRADPSVHQALGLFPVDTTLGSVVLDPSGAYVYARGANGDIHVVADPSGPAPLYLGVISRIGDASDDGGMAWDSVANALIVVDSDQDTVFKDGRIVRLD